MSLENFTLPFLVAYIELTLITYGFDKNKMTDSFHIHRSTQDNILMSLIEKFGKENLATQTKLLLKSCENYCLLLRKRSDIEALNNFMYHLKILNTNNPLLNEWQKKSIQSLVGSVYVDFGHYRLGANLLENSLHFFQTQDSVGKQHETRYTMCYLGIAEKEMENYQCASRILETAKKQYQMHHVDFSDYYFNLTRLHSCYAQLFEGEEKSKIINMKKTLVDCIMIFKNYSSLDLNLAMACQELGALYLFADKNYEQAEHYLRKSILLYKKIYGREAIKAIRAELWLSVLLRFQGKYEKALEILKSIHEKSEHVLQKSGFNMSSVLIMLGENYRKMGQLKKAERYFSEGALQVEKDHGKNELMKYWDLNFLAKFYIETGKTQEAMTILEKSLETHQAVLGPKHFKIAWVSHLLGLCYMKNGNYSEAGHLFQNSLQIYEDFYGRHHHVYGLVLKDYGLLCALRGNPEKGIALIKNAEKIFIDINHPAQQKCRAYLKERQWILKKSKMMNAHKI